MWQHGLHGDSFNKYNTWGLKLLVKYVHIPPVIKYSQQMRIEIAIRVLGTDGWVW